MDHKYKMDSKNLYSANEKEHLILTFKPPQQSRTFGPTLARRWCPTKNNLGPTSGR